MLCNAASDTLSKALIYLYYPSWLNVWESHSYNTALKTTGANGWRFKRFGIKAVLDFSNSILSFADMLCNAASDTLSKALIYGATRVG
jgi:hypothetical protein